MADNEFQYGNNNKSEHGYKFKAVFFFKNLKYLDYVLIDESLRQQAAENCKDMDPDQNQD